MAQTALTTHAIDAETAATVSRNLELAAAFTKAAVNDPAMLDDVPRTASLIFLPDDDPAFFETNLRVGLAAARRGENVYFVHVHRNADGTLALRQQEDTLTVDGATR